MRGSIIEELYYGNIDPQDRGYRPKLPAKKASRLSERSGGKAHRAARRRKQVAVPPLLQRLRRVHGRIRAGHLHHRLPLRRTVYDGCLPERRRAVRELSGRVASAAEFEKCIFQHRFSIEKCNSLLLRLKIRRIFTENSLYSLDEGE